MPMLSLTYGDAYGRTTKRLIEVEPQALLADYEAIATTFVTLSNAMTDLGLLRIDLVLDSLVSGYAAEAAANLDTGATFAGFITGEGSKKATHKVPGIRPALVGTDGTIDLTQTAVANYLAQFLAAGPFRLSDDETIASWIRGILDR